MQTLAEAQERVLQAITPLALETVPITEAAGRFLGEPVRAPLDLPSFDNSAMDGYAVRSADIAGATSSAPVILEVVGRVAAGQPAQVEVQAGKCVRIFTGSSLPIGADAVVMQEDTRSVTDSNQVAILDRAMAGENIRRRGEDVARESQVLEEGHRIWAGSLALLSSLGIPVIRARRRPVIGLLATGAELQEPGKDLAPGNIYESNRLSLATLLERAGAHPHVLPLVGDHLTDIRARLIEAFAHCDGVVSTGGVSVGELDLVKVAFSGMGGEIGLWRVAIKPGKPFMFGRWQNKLFFGLPGNPVSAFVTGALFVRPAVMRWQGASHWSLDAQTAILSEPLSNEGDRAHFVRVTIDKEGRVALSGKQASHVLSSLARANGLLELGPGCRYAAGSSVKVLRLDV